ncbi:peptidase inhibitor family I36 protein [Nonomuraea sp. MTCD27]|uniref:peptidase inhibitor family I36 protein n=1 Tax=Nonomuraea sp. MTCD27 TaxID=1676747 RepID=UPI0035C13335
MFKIRTLMLALALALTPLPLAGPARAADGFSRCPNGHLCLFSEFDGNGTIAWFQSGAPNLEPLGVKDARSAWNRTGRSFCLFASPNYEVHNATVPPGHKEGLNPEIAYNSVRAC